LDSNPTTGATTPQRKRAEATTILVSALLLACVLSAYGFRAQSVMFQYWLPGALLAGAFGWAIGRPGRPASPPSPPSVL
jgi:hypothetical protein